MPDRRPLARESIIALSLAGWLGLSALPARGVLPFEGEPIRYLTAEVHDPVARLQKALDRGEASLDYDRRHGYLKSVLDRLGVPVSSQVLVFSKTSFQHQLISPRAPRALYFNDDVYVGWVRGGDVLEIASIDPDQGSTFYLLDQEKSRRPSFQRQTHDCLQCHASGKTQEVPGLLVRSVYPDGSGGPVFNAGSFVTGHESPFEERWGGWYVTGSHGRQEHMGNVFVTDREHPERLDRASGSNVTDLSDRFDVSPYLSGHSDIAALMVLEHQTQMHNLITLANYQARLALHYEAGINKALGRPHDAISPSTERRIRSPVEKLLRYMLFSGEPALSDPVSGTSGFADQFAASGPRDSRGRSLRELDLRNRLFKYPCSFLIHSDQIDALPAPARDHLSRRLGEVLTGRDPSPDFAHLSPEDRRAILEILRDTEPGLLDERAPESAGPEAP
jgi:hypothetical protein